MFLMGAGMQGKTEETKLFQDRKLRKKLMMVNILFLLLNQQQIGESG